VSNAKEMMDGAYDTYLNLKVYNVRERYPVLLSI